MGTTNTNKEALAYSVEATPGNLAGSPVWKSAEFNAVPGWGAQIEKISRALWSVIRILIFFLAKCGGPTGSPSYFRNITTHK